MCTSGSIECSEVDRVVSATVYEFGMAEAVSSDGRDDVAEVDESEMVEDDGFEEEDGGEGGGEGAGMKGLA